MAANQETTRYDSAEPRQSTRSGKQRGVYIYIPAHELRKAGIDPHGEPPRYKTWGNGDRGASVFVRLYPT